MGPHGVWSAAVMGSDGEEFGLAVFTDPSDYDAMASSILGWDDLLAEAEGGMVWLSAVEAVRGQGPPG